MEKDLKIYKVDPLKIKVREGLPRWRKEMGDVADLAESLKVHGQLQPIVITEDFELIAGGRRLAACLFLQREIDCIKCNAKTSLELRELEAEENLKRKDFTPAESLLALRELHTLRQEVHGKAEAGAAGGWGAKETAEELGKSKSSVAEDLALAEVVVQHPELKECKNKSEIRRAAKAIKRVEERVERLAVYEKKAAETERLFFAHADCRDWMKTLEANSMDLLLTDPPYGIDVNDKAIGIGGHTRMKSTTAGFQYEDKEEYAFPVIASIAEESARIAKPTAHAFVFCAPEHFTRVSDIFRSHGWSPWVRPLIWIKKTTGQNNNPHMWPSSCYEMIMYARMPEAKFILEGKPDWIQEWMVSGVSRVHSA